MSIMAFRGFVLDVSRGYGDTTLFLFRRFVDLFIICESCAASLRKDFSDRRSQSSLQITHRSESGGNNQRVSSI